MTPEEIKKIAEEYRKENDYHQDVANDVVELLQWLSARYYLVEKGKAKQEYQNCIHLAENHPNISERVIAKSVADELKSLFGPDIRKEEEE